MKPFNLEAARRGEPIICRDGTIPTEFYHFETAYNNSKKIVAVVGGDRMNFNDNGVYIDCMTESSLDLFMQSKTVTGWVNIYKSYNAKYEHNTNFIYSTKEEALLNKAYKDYLTTAKIEYEL